MVGQEHVLKALVNALDQGRLHHAYLFTGTRGVGKTTIARIFARCLNCEQGVTSSPCGACSACREITEGRFIDLIEVDAASRTTVEDTRELMENVQYAPTRGRFKVYLIDEVHMLSTHSFNALLKTLEEPPPHVKFLLATTDPQKLPATILSRCLQFNLKNMPAERIVAHLQHVLGEEGIACDEAALWLLAEAARGSMRDALSLTDQAIGYGAGAVTADDVRSMLGTIDRQALTRLLAAVVAGEGRQLFDEIEQLAAQGTDFQGLLDALISLLHAIAVAQAVPETVPQGQADTQRIAGFARDLSGEDVQIFYQMAINGRRDMPYVPDPRRGFEMVALRLLTFRPVLDEERDEGPAEGPAEGHAEGHAERASAGEPAAEREVPAGKKPEAPCGGAAAEGRHGAAGPAPTAGADSRSLAAALGPEPQPSPRGVDGGRRPPAAPPPVPPARGGREPPAAAATDQAAPVALAELEPGHWNRIFPALQLSGVARNIAANAVLAQVVGTRLEFVMDAEQGALFNEEHGRRLRMALCEYFGQDVDMSIAQGEQAGETPALYRRRLRAERLEAAVSELQEDDNVRLLIEQFDGRLETSTVQPLD